MSPLSEVFISVDVETAGPHPGGHALLSIGACLVSDPGEKFYVELQPDRRAAVVEALAISKLSLDELAEHGMPPVEAMWQFKEWILEQTRAGGRPIFVAFNAPFDWMFVADYFHRYLGHNPFGHSALDLKAFYMGLTGAPWSETSLHRVAQRYGCRQELAHHALADAIDQAALFREMLAEARQRGWSWHTSRIRRKSVISDPQMTASESLEAIVESARRLGVELDQEEALQWLASMASWQTQDALQVDDRTGVFGHRVVMLDFSPAELAYFREIGRLVEFKDRPGVVETALALSGSSAQSKIQTFPGDCDYFERVNIIAPTREEACRILGGLMREKAESSARGPTYQLIEVKFGSYPFDVVVEGAAHKAGMPIAWKPAQIAAGQIEGFLADGAAAAVRWDDVAMQPGWCKLDWVVADPVRGRLANASNMLDVTWEAPDGAIVPLDGYLDPYFQEVYLEAESVPIFAKLAQHVSADALDDYVSALEREVKKYLTKDVNYGKAAKRMYNVFRLTGRYPEAMFIRELFDEPASLLYQVWSLIRTLDDTVRGESTISVDRLLAQTDRLILDVVATLEGEEETEIVRQLLNLRNRIAQQQAGSALTFDAEAARQRVINIVNNFFHDRLVAIPPIREYMASLTH